MRVLRLTLYRGAFQCSKVHNLNNSVSNRNLDYNSIVIKWMLCIPKERDVPLFPAIWEPHMTISDNTCLNLTDHILIGVRCNLSYILCQLLNKSQKFVLWLLNQFYLSQGLKIFGDTIPFNQFYSYLIIFWQVKIFLLPIFDSNQLQCCF